MGIDDIPAATKSFIERHLHSIEQLEVLLQLARELGVGLTAADICKTLKTNETSVGARLEDLHARGLAVAQYHHDKVKYVLPDSASLRASVEQVARYYSSHRVTIIELIFSRPTEAVRSFADAFRFQKKP